MVTAADDIKKQYEKYFDSVAFAQGDVTVGGELIWTVEDFYHRLFKEGKLPGKNLLDVGCGPTIRGAISASAYISDIYLAEYMEGNRKVVEKWLKKDADCVDFAYKLKYVAALEGNPDYEAIEERTRNSIKGVYYCDILADNPLHPRPHEQFDVVVSSLCVDCYPEDEDYFNGMKNVAGLIRKGGHIALTSAYKGSTYHVANQKFGGTIVDEDKIRRAMKAAKLEIIELNEHLYTEGPPEGADNEGFLTVLAVKI